MRYYGWYTNRRRGEREKREQAAATANQPDVPAAVEIIDVSDCRPKKIPSLQWRECTPRAIASRHIKKERSLAGSLIWEVDPLECPKCGCEMRSISFITETKFIRKILEHFLLWEEEERIRLPPHKYQPYSIHIHEPYDDGWPGYEEPYTMVH